MFKDIASDSQDGQTAIAKKGGRRSAKQKAPSANNALKTGMFAQEVILSSGRFKEDPREFDALLRGLGEYLLPDGPLEMNFVERIAIAVWKNRRVLKVEKDYILDQIDKACDPSVRTEEEQEQFRSWWAELHEGKLHLQRLKLMKEDPKAPGLLREKYWQYVCMFVSDNFGADVGDHLEEIEDFDEKKKFMLEKAKMDSPEILDAALAACQRHVDEMDDLLDTQLWEEGERRKVAMRRAIQALILDDNREDVVARRKASLNREVMDAYGELRKLQEIRIKRFTLDVRSYEPRECAFDGVAADDHDATRLPPAASHASITEGSSRGPRQRKLLHPGGPVSPDASPKLLPPAGSPGVGLPASESENNQAAGV